MRLRTLLVLAILAGSLLNTQPAHALGVFGQWQDSKDINSGFGIGLKHNFSIVPMVGVEARVSWLSYGDAIAGESMSMIPLEAFGRMKFGLFYGGLGLGYYIFTGNDFKPDNEFGGFPAVGAEFALMGLGGFAELRYLVLKPGDGDASGFGANVGVTFPI